MNLIKHQHVYWVFFILLLYTGNLYSSESVATRIDLPLGAYNDSISIEFDVKKGNLHYIELPVKEYSKIEASYRFENYDGETFSEGSPGLRLFLRESTYLIEVLSKGVTIDHGTAIEVFNAAPGTYRLYLQLSYHQQCPLCSSYSSGWKKLPEAITVRMDISLKNNEILKLNPWINNFSGWLDIFGLSKYFSVSNIVPRKIGGANDAPGITVELNTNLGSRDIDTRVWSSINDRDQISSIENEFMKTIGVDLWWRMATKISLLSGIKRDKIEIRFPLYCAPGLYREVSPGSVRPIGRYCQMTSMSRPVEPIKVLGASKGQSRTLHENPNRFSEIVHKILDDTIKRTGGKVVYLYQSNDYIEAEIFGSRGAIIDSGRLWERLQVSISLVSRGNERLVRIFVDGMTASGMGESPPPKSRFTEPMEPIYAEALNNFTKLTLNNIVNYYD